MRKHKYWLNFFFWVYVLFLVVVIFAGFVSIDTFQKRLALYCSTREILFFLFSSTFSTFLHFATYWLFLFSRGLSFYVKVNMKKIKTFIPTYEKIINSCYAEYFNVLHSPVNLQYSSCNESMCFQLRRKTVWLLIRWLLQIWPRGYKTLHAQLNWARNFNFS